MSQLMDSAGAPLPGFLDESAKKGAPAVLVLHEWWGLNEQMKGVARRLAGEGFLAFAVDLFHGNVPKTQAEASAAREAMDSQRALQQLHASVQALLPKGSGRVGVLGFCMGGAYALATAAHNPEVKAVVAYYGIPQPPLADVTKIRAKVLGHFASRDRFVSPERVEALEKALKGAGVQATLYRYEADHAFANERRPEVYSPEAEQLAWQRTISFLQRELDAAPVKR